MVSIKRGKKWGLVLDHFIFDFGDTWLRNDGKCLKATRIKIKTHYST